MNQLTKINFSSLIMMVCCVGLYSCYSGKKAQASRMIASVKKAIVIEAKQINEIETIKEQKNIDSTIDNRVKEKLHRYDAELQAMQTKTVELQNLLSNNKNFRKAHNTIVKPALKKMDAFVLTSQARILRYHMINDGIANATKKLFELAAFFGPGKYIIPEDKTEMAFNMFTPIVDSLIVFANNYSEIEQTGNLVINGYADATGIGETSELYRILVEALNKTTATKAELNQQLSQLRAGAIASLLNNLVNKKQTAFKSWKTFSVNLFEYGQGETYPTQTIKDYTEDDERRRVVLIYWCILPRD
jgi:outer membrane protein OmpA-like peptidoglycan-associated protein